MFTQFRVRYPNGCLITELLTINHGKYIVRASAQVDGVNLATGMAAAETVEQAEDQARIRALVVLGIYPTTKITSDTNGTVAEVIEQQNSLVPTPISETTSLLETKVPIQNSIFPETSNNKDKKDKKDKTIVPISELTFSDSASDTTPVSWEEDLNQFSEPLDADELEASQPSNISELQISPTINAKPVATETKGRTKRSNQEKLDTLKPATVVDEFSPSEPEINTGKASSSIPVDLSEVIAGTTVQMKRLGWSNQQGRDYLMRTYNKKTRADLTPEELVEFFNYLEALPSPED